MKSLQTSRTKLKKARSRTLWCAQFRHGHDATQPKFAHRVSAISN